MRTAHLLAPALLAALLLAGCAGPEQKFGRGVSNAMEPTRLGELGRSIEQTSLWDGSEAAYSVGFVRGVGRTLRRTATGLFEIVTSPFPPYDHVYMRPEWPVYPDSYKPKMVADSIVSTDAAVGFSGGDVVPMIPGSRFRIFDY